VAEENARDAPPTLLLFTGWENRRLITWGADALDDAGGFIRL
jgi:hypothetical protein